MGKRIIFVVAFILVIGLAGLANAVQKTVTFDTGLQTPDYYGYSYLGEYDGLLWGNVGYVDVTNAWTTDFEKARVSGNNVAYSYSTFWFMDIVSISMPDTISHFDFISAYLNSVWQDATPLEVTGSRNGETVYDMTFDLGTTGAALYTFNFTDVDLVTLVGFGWIPTFAMDNVTYDDRTAPIQTPEPATFCLLAMGLLSLAGFRKRLK